MEPPALHPNAVGFILRNRAAKAGIMSVGMERILAHTRHRDLKTMRGYVLRAKLTDNPAKLLGL